MILEPFHTLGDPSLIELRGTARNFMVAMGSNNEPAHWMTLLGPSGAGKTMISKLCYRYFSRHLDAFLDERFDPTEARIMRRGMFCPWVDIIQTMMSGDYSIIRDMRECWLLVIDDIGAEYQKTRELATSKLYEILNAREGLWTIITANLKRQQIAEQMDPRIISRMLRNNSVVLDVEAIDYNLRDHN